MCQYDDIKDWCFSSFGASATADARTSLATPQARSRTKPGQQRSEPESSGLVVLAPLPVQPHCHRLRSEGTPPWTQDEVVAMHICMAMQTGERD